MKLFSPKVGKLRACGTYTHINPTPLLPLLAPSISPAPLGFATHRTLHYPPISILVDPITNLVEWGG